MNEFPNKLWTKNSINRKLNRHRLRLTGNFRPLKKMFTQLTIWFSVKKIRHKLTEWSVKSHASQTF